MKHIEYEEKKSHGDKSFALRYYPPEPNFPISSMPLHWHRECELIRVTKGELKLFLDSKKYIGKEGDVFLLPSGALHRAEAQNAYYECVVFSPEILFSRRNEKVSSYITPFISGESAPWYFSTEQEPDICRAVNDFFRTVEAQDSYFELILCGKLLEIFYLLCKSSEKLSEKILRSSSRQRSNISVLLQWIEKNLSEKITLSDMAAAINVNQQYLCKIFKEYTGSTPVDYLNELRIDRACFEISVNRKNATEAAYATGFNDQSYFSKVFRKYRGISPTEYKKSLNGIRQG